MTSWHLGALHPAEQVLTLVLAFGPFIVLGLVLRHRGRSEDQAEGAADGSGATAPPRDQPSR